MSKIKLPRRFSAFIITQSLGAFNDNFFKMLLQLYVLQIIAAANAEDIISRATFLFTVPFVLFGPWSGYFADRFSKTNVMRTVKFAEIAVMLIGALAFYLASLNLMLIVLFLMAAQSTFFSPAKYGYIPEACEPAAVTKANSVVSMSTFFAIILGTAVTGLLLTLHHDSAVSVALYCIGVAILGSVSALFIDKGKPGEPATSFPWNPLSGIVKDIVFLKRQKPLFLASLADSYFWMLGLVFQTNILIYAKNLIPPDESSNILLALFPALLGVGIAAGSMLASRWSGKKVELGLVPLGGLGVSFAAIALYFVNQYWPAAIILFLAGIFGGLFVVPLYAYLQFNAKEKEKGRVLATVGILNGLFLVLGALLYNLLAVQLGISAAANFLILGLMTIGVVIYICSIIPEYFVRFCFWLLTHTFYRIKIIGAEHVPFRGPALLTPNHVTYVDAFLIGATIQRFIRFIMIQNFYDLPVVKQLFKLMEVIPINPKGGRKAVTWSLEQAKKQLQNGHTVCIFPEGQITRHGDMNEFRRGFETIMDGLECPIIPVYLHNLWGSIFSFSEGKVIWKRPKRIPYRVTVSFGKPLPPGTSAKELESAVQALAEQAEI